MSNTDGNVAGVFSLKSAILGAEPWTDAMRVEIEKRLDIMAIDIYGLSEIIGPGVSSECPEKSGLHVNEDHFYPEIIAQTKLFGCLFLIPKVGKKDITACF